MFDPWHQSKLNTGVSRLKEISKTPVPEKDTTIEELKVLAGVTGAIPSLGATFGMSAQEKSRIMRQNGIKPGDEAWFKLWFSKPTLTGEKPFER